LAKSKVTKRDVLIAAAIVLALVAYELVYKKNSIRSFLIIAAIVIPLAAIYVFIELKIRGRGARKRKAALKKNAVLMGFSFNEDPDESLFSSLLPGFVLFTLREGVWYEFINYMEGEAGGHDVVVFDYGYMIEKYHGDTVGYKRVVNTICILNQNSRHLPSFQLRSKGMKDKLRDKVGLHDIDPRNDSEFAKHCWLTGEDEEAVRELFGPAVTQAFRDGSALRDIAIEGAGNRLMYYHIGHIPPEGLTDFIFRAGEVSRLFNQP